MDSKADGEPARAALQWPEVPRPAAATTRKPTATLARIPAPLYFSACFAVGAGLQHLLGLPAPPASWTGPLQAIGTVLANASLLLVFASLALFARARTTLMPGGSASRLVTGGPFRFSRNPMYVSLVLAYAGIALMLDLPWALALLPAPVLVLQYVQIPFEEARMARLFGHEYLRYRDRIRRWL